MYRRMPGGKRCLSKTNITRTLPPPGTNSVTDDFLRSKCSVSSINESLASRIISPKHIPIPTIPQESTIVFEFYMFAFSVMASFLQFLHLYRSVWWLPQSYTRHTMAVELHPIERSIDHKEVLNEWFMYLAESINFYLIDPYLVGFIVIILGRRLIYSILSKTLSKCTSASLWPLFQKLLTLILLIAVFASLFYCSLHIMKNHPVVNILYLCYPISVYFILFGLSISPFFDMSSFYQSCRESKKTKLAGKPIHSCSTSPQFIRDEVDFLRSDFNTRMKQILISSILSAYYAAFLPWCFAQASLYYDAYWVTQHMALVWLGCFTMHSAYCYPPSYCDTLHRAALHLGRWVRIQGRNQHLPSHIWDETTLWTQGALVRYSKDLYKAEGLATAAEPGNSTQYRFYALFNDPSALFSALLGLQSSLVLLQLVALARASEWHQVISVTLLLFTNYYMLFRLTRNYLVCWKVYKAEQLIQEKTCG